MQRQSAPVATIAANYCATCTTMPKVLSWIYKISSATGQKDFFIPEPDMVQVIRYMMGVNVHNILSINRPQHGCSGIVHKLEWRGLKLVTVAQKPLFFV